MTIRPRTTKNKQRRIKARKMYVYKDTLSQTKKPQIHGIWTYKSELHAQTGNDFMPVSVLPADRESVERMVEQGTVAASNADANDRCSYRDMVIAIAESWGLTAKEGK